MGRQIGLFECGDRTYIIEEADKGIEVFCDGKKVQDKLSYVELLNYMSNIIYNESYMRNKAEQKVKVLENKVVALEKQIGETNQF